MKNLWQQLDALGTVECNVRVAFLRINVWFEIKIYLNFRALTLTDTFIFLLKCFRNLLTQNREVHTA